MQLWERTARSLPAGGHRKITCCGDTASMRVENGKEGYRGYCFRCNRKTFIAHGTWSIGQLRQRDQEFLARSRGPTTQVSLPADYNQDIPPERAVWLYRASIDASTARHYRFGWSESTRRILLPVYGNSRLEGYTARATEVGQKPKYIERFNEDAVFWADPRLKAHALSPSEEAHLPALCIAEDILSAVRIGYVLQLSCALLGTSASAKLLVSAANVVALRRKAYPSYPEDHPAFIVALWLDPDRAGLRGAAKLARSLELMGVTCRYIRSSKDPKYYTAQQIKEYLLDRRDPIADHEA